MTLSTTDSQGEPPREDVSVLITGASGLLGLNLALDWQDRARVSGVSHNTILHDTPFPVITADLTDKSQMDQVLERIRPQVIIHCAALASLDKCVEDPALAQRLNAELPGRLAKWAKGNGSYLLHISTDAVFDGTAAPYRETDTPNPLSVYAKSKLEGEQRVLAEDPDAAVCRVVFYGCSLSGARSLAEFFYNNLAAGRPVNGVTDVLFCPLFVMELSGILRRIAEKRLSGLYHVVSSEFLSKYDFGVRIARAFGFNENLVKPVSWKDIGLKAVRSPDLRLDTRKIETALELPMPGIDNGLDLFRRQIAAGYPGLLKTFTRSGQ
jgi:dTDP-4-dehydrorhamnose reductase